MDQFFSGISRWRRADPMRYRQAQKYSRHRARGRHPDQSAVDPWRASPIHTDITENARDQKYADDGECEPEDRSFPSSPIAKSCVISEGKGFQIAERIFLGIWTGKPVSKLAGVGIETADCEKVKGTVPSRHEHNK